MKNIKKEGLVTYDALIVLGKNIGVGWTSSRIRKTKYKLSPHSIITVLAAGHLYELGIAKKLIFSGGYTAGYDMPSEAQSMASYLFKNYPYIRRSDVIMENKSVDTVTNARQVSKIIKEQGYNNVAVITVGAHAIRAERIFKGIGIDAIVLSSESILRERSKRDEKTVRNYTSSFSVRVENLKENIMRAWSFIDRKYTIPHTITSITRS